MTNTRHSGTRWRWSPLVFAFLMGLLGGQRVLNAGKFAALA